MQCHRRSRYVPKKRLVDFLRLENAGRGDHVRSAACDDHAA